MNKVILTAAAGLFIGAAISPAVAGQTYYLLAVDILATDGSVALHQQLKCPRYEKCSKTLPFTLQGKQQVLTVNAQVPDDHHIQVTVDPDLSYVVENGKVRPKPFESNTELKAFEPGNEWTTELQNYTSVPVDPSKRTSKFQTKEFVHLTVLKLHMKLN